MIQLFSFKGTLNRSKFIYLFLATITVYTAAFYIFPSKDLVSVLLRLIIMITSAICYLSVIVRRTRDIGKNILLIFVPIYNIYLLFLLFTKKGINVKG